jgi:hypothetical protein
MISGSNCQLEIPIHLGGIFMKQLFIKTFIVLFSICCTVRGSDRSKSDTSHDLVVIGKLLRINRNTLCGNAQFSSLSEYGDLTIISGKYNDSQIYVVHPCVEMPRTGFHKNAGTLQKFTVGDYHKLILSTENVYGGFYQKEDIDPGNAIIYFCRTVDKAKKP